MKDAARIRSRTVGGAWIAAHCRAFDRSDAESPQARLEAVLGQELAVRLVNALASRERGRSPLT